MTTLDRSAHSAKTKHFILVGRQGNQDLNIHFRYFTHPAGDWVAVAGVAVGIPSGTRDWHHAYHNLDDARAEYAKWLRAGFRRNEELESYYA